MWGPGYVSIFQIIYYDFIIDAFLCKLVNNKIDFNLCRSIYKHFADWTQLNSYISVTKFIIRRYVEN